MPLVVYLDETGDHTLEAVDHAFPIFALVLLIMDGEAYTRTGVGELARLKLDYFGHEGVILHSRDIRKAQGDFGFLTDPSKRSPFYERINALMGGLDYRLIASVIRKQDHKDLYGITASNPYDLALKFALERLLPLLEDAGQSSVTIVAESRGKREDDELNLTFLRTVTYGTYFVSAERFRAVQFRLVFVPKSRNLTGHQMADLAAYPIARHVLDPSKPNPAYDTVARKLYQGKGRISGLKIFP